MNKIYIIIIIFFPIFVFFCTDDDNLLNQIKNYPNQNDKLKAAEEFIETKPDFAKKILESIRPEKVNQQREVDFEDYMHITPYDLAQTELKKIDCYKKRGKDYRFKDLHEAKDFLLKIDHSNIKDKMACGFWIGICNTDAGQVEIEPEIFAGRVYAFRSELKEGKYLIESFGIMFNEEIDGKLSNATKHGFFFSEKKDGYTLNGYCSGNNSFDDILHK